MSGLIFYRILNTITAVAKEASQRVLKIFIADAKKAPLPQDIDLSDELVGMFGKHEIEASALNLLRFLKERCEGWTPFRLEALIEFYKEKGLDPNTMLFGLMGPWVDAGPLGLSIGKASYLIHVGASLAISDEFVDRVAKHAKNKKKRPKGR